MIMRDFYIKTYSNKNFKMTSTFINTTKCAVAGMKSYLLVGFLNIVFAAALSAQCEFINLACNDLINVSINEDCYASINADLLLENPPFGLFPDDGVNYEILLQDELGYPLIPSNQVGEDQVGMTIKASITLVPCNISCWGYIYVEDKIGPKFWNCIDGELPTIDLDCDEFSNGYVIPDPLVGSVCETIDELSFEDDTTALNCVDEFAVTITRLWTASDLAGNKTKCQQTINIRKYDLKEVIIPSDFIMSIDPDADCNESLDVSPERTGYPTGIYCPNIMYYYSDINYPQCGLQIKILRDWFVIDWCTGQSLTSGQIIKIIDDTPPRVVCELDTLMVPKASYECTAAPILNPLRVPGYDTLASVTVLDTCPEEIFVEVGFLIAEENKPQPLDSPYYNVEPNEDGVFPLPEFENSAWIRYCFSDACGNETEIPDDAIFADSLGYCCYFQLDAKDQSPPTPICEGFTKVPLGAGGLTEVLAESFDDNSYDPCGEIVHYEVRRESGSCPGYTEHGNQGWSESVHFCCEDLGDTITIRLRVFDDAGNFSECLGLVCVTDPVTPSVECPDPYVELDCGDSYRDYNLIGFPTGLDGCDAGIRIGDEYFDLSNYDLSCGIGTIIRTIEVNDAQGNLIKVCVQEIEYDADAVSTTLEPGDFEFPDDVTIDVCDSGGSLDPVFTGIPFTNKEFGCANIAITYEDSPKHTQNSNGVCYTIIREWQVVDWCNYHPSRPNEHILKASQEIRVINTAVPDFACPHDITVNTSPFECEAYVDLTVSVSSTCPTSFDLEWSIDAFSDGMADFVGLGNDASGVFPVGEHTITFTGRNKCGGNSASCTYRFTVEGDKPPVPICLAELTWSVGSGVTEVWASDFDLKSEGGCGLSDLSFSFVDPFDSNYPEAARSFSCDDIPNGIAADIPIEVFVIDEEGRYSSCLATLQLQDTGDVCPDQSNGNIVSGEIITEMSEPLEQVMVELHNMQSDEYMMDMTSSNGAYAFDEVMSTNSYELKPSYDKDYLNGVSTLDLLLIQRHILGLSELSSAYKLIAADIDNSGAISAIDLIQLRKLILGIYDDLPENNSWVFVPQAHKFIDEKSPWDYPDYLSMEYLSQDAVDADFVAIKVGDVDNSSSVRSSGSISKRSSESVFLSSKDQNYRKGELVAVPIMLEESFEFTGMQFTLSFDDEALLFQGVDGGAVNIGQENFALLNSLPGKITFSVSNAQTTSLEAGMRMFTIYFEASRNTSISAAVDLNSELTYAEIYDDMLNSYDIDFVVRSSESNESKSLSLFQNEPNPFNASTSISFYNPENQIIKLEIMDANGRLIFEEERNFGRGMNKYEIFASDLDAQGILLYRISSNSTSITKKMIMVK